MEDLLKRVEEEHERVVSGLREEIRALRAEIRTLRATAHGHEGVLDMEDIKLVSREAEVGETLALRGVYTEKTVQISPSTLSADFSQLGQEADADEQDGGQALEKMTFENIVKLVRAAVISPNWTWRLYWECTGLVLVCFDMINIPLSTVFEPDQNAFSIFMDWTTLLFWTVDMAQAFFVGYYDKGQLVVRQPAVVKNYLKTWFLMDAITVVPDWFLTLAGTGSQAGDFSRLLRTSRAIRILRLLRVMKLQRVLNKLYDYIDNEYSFIIAELVKMMMVILVVNHVIACGWFGVGKLSVYAMGQPSWINWSENFLAADMGYQYFTSLHWTLTQFTPASMDVVARNIIERIYSIIVLLFAMVAFSSIVGTVTSSMTVIRTMKNDRNKQFWLLRRFFNQKGVSSDLTLRVTRYLEFVTQRQQKLIQPSKVTFLPLLSDQLQREVAFEMFQPCMAKHPFMCFLSDSREWKVVASRICQMSMKSMQVATGDTIFSLGEEASKAFIFKGGELVYTHSTNTITTPEEKEWLAEAAIWTPWRYRGKLFANKPSDLLTVEASSFAQAVSIHPKPVTIARRYGSKFVNALNKQTANGWSDVFRDEGFFSTAMLDCDRQVDDDSWWNDSDDHLNGLYNGEDGNEGYEGRRRPPSERSQQSSTRSPASAPRASFIGRLLCLLPCAWQAVRPARSRVEIV